MRTILAFLLLGLAYEASSQSCHLREIDLCLSTPLLSLQANGIPTTDDAVTETCEACNEGQECFTNFTQKCMTPMHRELIGLFSQGSNGVYKDFCTPGGKIRTEYLKFAPCLSDYLTGDDVKTCTEDIVTVIETISEKAFDDRLATACCGYKRLRGCLQGGIEPKCGKDAFILGDKVIAMAISEIPALVCGSFDPEGSRCQSLLPPSGTPPKGNSDSKIATLLNTLLKS